MNKFLKLSKRYQKKKINSKKKLYIRRKQNGGGPEMENLISKMSTMRLEIYKKQLDGTNNSGTIVSILGGYFRLYFTKNLLDELNSLDTTILEKYKFENQDFFSKIKSLLDKYFYAYERHFTEVQAQIIKILFDIDIIIKRDCFEYEYMKHDFDHSVCKNKLSVMGNCSQPFFFDSLSGYSVELNNKFIELFNIIETKLKKGSSIGIILGRTMELPTEYDINLYFNANGSSFSSIIKEIENESLSKHYNIGALFPLNLEPDNLRVLKKIIDLTNDYNIYLVNMICYGCYRSFYYLKNNAKQNFTYITAGSNIDFVANPPFTLVNRYAHEVNNCFTKPYNNEHFKDYQSHQYD
jgi:hypothetical protein